MPREHGYAINTELFAGLVILLLFAFVYSYQVVNSLAIHRPLESYSDWQGASWIEAGEISGKGYFRRQFSLSSLPERAYFVISATDEFFVYVNGRRVASNKYFGARPSGIVDVTKLLQQGKNVLAVMVDSATRSVAPAMIGRLSLTNADGVWRDVISDASWVMLRHEAFQRGTKVDWTSPKFNDLHWQLAKVYPVEQSFVSLPLSVPEYVYRSLPQGKWIWSGNSDVAVLSKTFAVNTNKIHHAWLSISMAGRYSLLVNDISVASLMGTKSSMELIDIAPYLQSGENHIWLLLESDDILPALLVTGSVITDRGVIDLNSTAQWKSGKDTAVYSGSRDNVPAVVRTVTNPDATTSMPSLVYREMAQSEILSTEKLLKMLMVFFVVVSVSAIIFAMFYRSVESVSKNEVVDCFVVFVRPFILGLVVLVAFILIDYDPEFKFSSAWQERLVIIIPVLILMTEVMMLLEIRSERKT